MKNKWILLASLMLIFGSVSFAQKNENYQGRKNYQNCRIDGLTDAQQSKIDEIRTEKCAQNQVLSADLKIKKAELDKLLIAEKPNEKEINKKIDEIGSIKTQMMKNRTQSRVLIREQLTPEQKLQFDSRKNHKRSGKKGGGKYHQQGKKPNYGKNYR